MQVGRRIIFDKVTGKIIMDSGEHYGDIPLLVPITELDFIDLPYGQDSDKFNRVKNGVYYVDVATKKIVFDELFDPIPTQEQQIAELQQQLLQAQGVV